MDDVGWLTRRQGAQKRVAIMTASPRERPGFASLDRGFMRSLPS